MRSFKLYDVEIDIDDYKSFKKWAKIQPELFGNRNFLTGFLNLEHEGILPKVYLEFYFYNKNFLRDKYELSQVGKTNAKGLSLEDFIINVMDENTLLPLTNFKIFYQQTLIYLRTRKEKDWNKEYQLLIPYWSFLSDMEHSGIENFNRYIIYLNKNIFSKQKGIQYGN